MKIYHFLSMKIIYHNYHHHNKITYQEDSIINHLVYHGEVVLIKDRVF
jgi:hypothetical protein